MATQRRPAAEGAPRIGATRWVALVAFTLLVVTTQVLWLTFASVTEQTQAQLGVSEGAVGDLAVINPIMFVLLAIPTGRWMDRRYAQALTAGALFTAAGATLRLVDPSSYVWVFAGQAVMSVGQPLVLNASTKIAARYFPPEEQTTAISIASGAQFVGILTAVLTSSWLLDQGGFRLLLGAHAALAVVAAVAVIASLRLPHHATDTTGRASLGWLRHDPLIWKLAGVLFVGFGTYNALATWLDAIMVGFGHGGVAGEMIALTTLAGVVGAAVIPGFVASRELRRDMVIATTLVLAAALLVIAAVPSPTLVRILLALVGLFLLGTLPVVLDWSEIHVGPERAGSATGVLLLAGNLGGVVVVLTVQAVISHPVGALTVLALWAVPGLMIALRLPRRAGEHEAIEDEVLP
ncbi:MAG: MFS transporter [Nocardioidaceae bacterium]|nr:MFS transporter [Nocardioidaceae bacterium]